MAQRETLPATSEARARGIAVPRIKIEHLWLGLPIALVVCFGFLLKLRTVDFWWHLKAGEVICTSRSIPHTDIFSFTAADRPFALQNWLAELVYYGVYLMGGLPLLVAFNTALLVAALLPVYSLCRKAAGSVRLSVLSVLLSAVSLLYFGSVRSQVFSFAFFSAFYWVLSSYRRRHRDLLWALPLLMLLWVNLHGAFVLGVGLIFLFLSCEAAGRILYDPRSDAWSTGEFKRLAVALVLTMLATLVNPEIYKLYGYVSAVATNPASQLFVLEWQPPRVDQVEGILLLYGPFFITLLVLLSARQKPELLEHVLFVVFSIFGMKAVRNGVWFTLVVAPILARYLPTIEWSGLLGSLRRFRLIESLASWVERRREAGAPIRYRLNSQIAVLMMGITVLLSPWVYPHLANKALGKTLWEPGTPVAAMDYIKQHGLQGNIFHPQEYGDYLIWRLWPQQRSFIDGRVHVFPESVVEDYLLVFRDRHWEERLAKYDIRFVLLKKGDEESRMMLENARQSPNWRLLYEDTTSVLFEKAR